MLGLLVIVSIVSLIVVWGCEIAALHLSKQLLSQIRRRAKWSELRNISQTIQMVDETAGINSNAAEIKKRDCLFLIQRLLGIGYLWCALLLILFVWVATKHQ